MLVGLAGRIGALPWRDFQKLHRKRQRPPPESGGGFLGSDFGNGKALNARGTSESQELILSEKNRSFFPGNQGGFNLSNLCLF